MMIELAISTRSTHSGHIRRLHSLYLHSCGLNARAYDTFAKLGICMSRGWLYGALEEMSIRRMKDFSKDFKTHNTVLSYDNVNINQRIYEQRVSHCDKRGYSDGSVGLGIIIEDSSFLFPLRRDQFCEAQTRGLEDSLTASEILMLEVSNSATISLFSADYILECLLTASDFDLATYSGSANYNLAPPSPVKQLPTGPGFESKYYLFRAEQINESSIDGNDELHQAFLRQLGLDNKDGRYFVKDMVLPMVFDQLSVSRSRSLKEQMKDEENSFDRNDWQLHLTAFFHVIMNYGRLVHEQYYLTNSGIGIAQACNTILGRKHLADSAIKGDFFHHVEELFLHMSAARFRDAWLQVSGKSKLSELRSETPEKLAELSKEILERLASTHALKEHDSLPERERDERFRQAIQFNRDLLNFVCLRRAIKSGDVGLIEILIPRLLFHFLGGGKSNYVKEMFELLQGLNKEWPEDLRYALEQFHSLTDVAYRDFVRKYCILVNTTGDPDGFEAIDMLVEHAVNDIKVSIGTIFKQMVIDSFRTPSRQLVPSQPGSIFQRSLLASRSSDFSRPLSMRNLDR